MSQQRIHVLVVEDDEISAPVACTMLERLGCEVSVATNGAEALDRFNKNAYDLILMDWQMPVMDGVEATARIRESRSGYAIPIVGTSARAGRLECMAAGMNDLIPKPFLLENMRVALSKWTRWQDDRQSESASQHESNPVQVEK